MKNVLISAMVLGLGGCAGQGPGFLDGLRGMRGYDRTPARTTRPATPPNPVPGEPPIETATLAPPENARTVEEFDTTTPEARAAAVAPAPDAGDGRLGTTIASLGDPGEAGFWIKTPLVSVPASGRIVYVTSGRSVQVRLIPSGGAAGSGSQVSLAAMRLLDAPLTGLPELVVYQN